MAQAMIAPSTPVSVPNRRGNRKTPEPIIEPTTIAVSVGRLTFSVTFSGCSVAVINLRCSHLQSQEGYATAHEPIADSEDRLEIGQYLLTFGVVLAVGDRAGGTQRFQFLEALRGRRLGRSAV